MAMLVTPGVYYEVVDTAQQGIAGIRTDIGALLGIAERGPLQQSVRVNSWKQFQSKFGNFISGGYLAYTAKAFFENGGASLDIVRIAAKPATETDAAKVQPPGGASSFVLETTGFLPGRIVRVRQDALVSHRTVQSANAVTKELVWDQPLDALLNLAAPITFESGALEATGVLLDGAGKPTLRIEAANEGTWGNAVAVHVSQAHPAATVTRNIPQPADRSGSLVASVSGFDPHALVRMYQPAPVSFEQYKSVVSVDTPLGLVVWDTALDATFDLTKPIYFETLEFGITVYERGEPREVFAGLALDVNHPRYVENVITADSSSLLRVLDLRSPSPFPTRLPALDAPNLVNGFLVLEWGRDGIAALTTLDFTGDPTTEDKWGVRVLEDVDEVAIVAAPDILIQPAPPPRFAPQPPPGIDPCLPCMQPLPTAPQPPPMIPEQPPTFSFDDVYRVQAALVAHCEDLRDRIAVLDPPLTNEAGKTADIGEVLSWRQRFDSKYAALYYPWLLVVDPLELGGEVVRAVPPSGHVVGMYANTDRTVGVWKAPANTEMHWIQDVTVQVTAPVQGLLNPKGINCIRAFPGRGLRIYGARTVSSDPDWIFVNVRRLMMMLEKAVNISIQWAVFEPNDIYLRQKIRVAISSFLTELWRRGALAGAKPEDAYFVKCDAQNNPPYVSALGQLIVEVGIAPTKPAEFVVFRIGRTDNTLEITE